MKPILIFFINCALLLSCSNEQQLVSYDETTIFTPSDTLFRVADPTGEAFAFVNQKGDTVVPFGRYAYTFTDTLVTFGVVVDQNDLVAINQRGRRIYEVYPFDNGPDYVEEGLFRIMRYGKIGFADTTGNIVIEPRFACAYPFSGGKAKVALECTLEADGEHRAMRSDEWFYIDKSGRRVQ